ncbi:MULTISPECIES: bifunctional DNA primase/polymerase [Streptomycetaceae]|uniref:DNA primase/polymerase bifunctional N-terminal domain-containing protein n=1 Tax=Streptantibioticus cattleyicolor (strain ATCC 35852 / DSM 46488 / JCM 4925 / NBRC 14057 / NRRL 8057) TaxID=1003195 RepID=F8JTR6_STREN|nr:MULTISPECIES: hypothetical protein [Streptomycetaceae]AEW96835.1 hypothetical protein SCATT_44640 [Streptantibioticus cattleyicolor NRRL 8057 = DSM 46488]MYS61316.1 hypothetical protein [Streptomyces sp. SID5468]CCB77165.1 conserved protein of unknown function [Streptantibioticus cattleyicolor NRRL 8057 = DSM 46488]
MDGAQARKAADWLASAAPDPRACRWAWERDPNGVALLPAGRRWDVAITDGTLGRTALAVLVRLAGRPGPVLATAGETRLGWLVPPGTGRYWVATGVRTAGSGSWIAVPHPGRRPRGIRWLVPPDGSGRLTDPALLESALHEAVALRHDDFRGFDV